MNAKVMTLSNDYNHPAPLGGFFSTTHNTLVKNDSAAVCNNITLLFLLRHSIFTQLNVRAICSYKSRHAN